MELYALTDNLILEKIGENIKRMRLEHNRLRSPEDSEALVYLKCLYSTSLFHVQHQAL